MAREKKSLRANNRQMGKGFFVCVIYCSGHELVYSIYTILLLIETFFLLFILSFFIVAIMTTFYIVWEGEGEMMVTYHNTSSLKGSSVIDVST